MLKEGYYVEGLTKETFPDAAQYGVMTFPDRLVVINFDFLLVNNAFSGRIDDDLSRTVFAYDPEKGFSGNGDIHDLLKFENNEFLGENVFEKFKEEFIKFAYSYKIYEGLIKISEGLNIYFDSKLRRIYLGHGHVSREKRKLLLPWLRNIEDKIRN